MNTHTLARLLIFSGLLIAAMGLLLYIGGQVSFFGLGRLPGDIRIEREGFRFYFPIVTCLVLSLILTAVMFVLSRLR